MKPPSGQTNSLIMKIEIWLILEIDNQSMKKICVSVNFNEFYQIPLVVIHLYRFSLPIWATRSLHQISSLPRSLVFCQATDVSQVC